MSRLPLILLVATLAGCANSYDIGQTVEGIILSHDRPASALSVSLVNSIDPNACERATAMAVSDISGHFSVSRTAKVGRFAVIVQNDTLCIFEGGRWQSVWTNAYGPAEPKIVFSCGKDDAAWRCTMNGLASLR
jgi:hypothetical protein